MFAALRRHWTLLSSESCPRCGLTSATGFCQICRRDFERVASPCPRCGLPAPCGQCRKINDWPLHRVFAPFVYGPPLAQYLQALKYQRQRYLGRVLGELLAAEIVTGAPAVDAIVPVPLHARRLRTRGFNQADEIARIVGAKLCLPVLVCGIKRHINTVPQTALDREARRLNPVAAFATSRSFDGMRLAIVDDIMTTGGTVNALARICRDAGAVSLEAWVVARSISKGEIEA